MAGGGPEGRSSLERQGRVHGAGGRLQPRGPQEAARVEASPACPGPRSPSRASAQVRAVSLGSGGGGLGQGPCGGGALTGAPMGVSFCSLRPSAPSLWALQTLPYAVIQADRHPHLHPPPVTLKSILGGRADHSIAGDKAEDLCIVGPDAPASHSQLLTGRLKRPGIAHSTFLPAWSFQSPEPGSAPQTGRPFPIGRAALFSADHGQSTPGTKTRSEAEPVMTFTGPPSHADPAFSSKTSLT